jgi:hypothetical protein
MGILFLTFSPNEYNLATKNFKPGSNEDESAGELASETSHESFFPVKQEQELHGYYHAPSENSHQNLNQCKVDECR